MTALGRELADLDGDAFADLCARLGPAARREALRERFRYDRQGFLRFLWPDIFTRPFVGPHLATLSRPKTPWTERAGSQVRTLRALAAPRGFSKTGITVADLCHDCCYGYERVVPILSAELGLSRTSMGTIREMLGAPKVAELFGAVSFRGGTDRYTVQVGRHPTTFIAKSFGTSVRGLKDGMVRPTRLIVDDGEDKLLVGNPDNRRKWWSFVTADILKLGDLAGGLILDWIGTVLHVDSVLSRLLVAPGWRSQKFSACLRWPTRSGLWAECGRVWGDLTMAGPWYVGLDEWVANHAPVRGCPLSELHEEDIRHRAAARRFYDAHRAEMDEGAEMLSESWLDVFAFHEVIWAEGLGACLQELQNTPRDPSATIYDSATFPRCRLTDTPQGLAVVRLRDGLPDGRAVPVSDLRISMRLDPIPADDLAGLGGGAGGSDFAAIAVLGRDRDGYTYILDGWLSRARDSQQLAALWVLGEKWRPWRATIESNGFQRLLGVEFRRQQAERRAAGKWADLSIASTADSNSGTNKNADIAALEPVIATSRLYFAEHLPTEGMLQFDDFPGGSHDDWPDVVARGWRDAGQGHAVGAVSRFGR